MKKTSRVLFMTFCFFALFFAKGTPAFAEGEWNVKSIEFIPSSSTVQMSRIMEKDNDGIEALNLANRGSNNRFKQCFFGEGDKCIVTYTDDSTREFCFSAIKGIGYAEFKDAGGSVINLEALMSDVAKELKQSAEVSVDELAAIIGQNGVEIEYGEYREAGDEIVGNYVRTKVLLDVVEDISHDHTKALRGRSKTPAGCEYTGMRQDCEYCQVCGEFFTDQTATTEISKNDLIIDKLGHDWGDWKELEPATEEAAGKKIRYCRRCGAGDTKIIPLGTHSHARSDEMHWTKPGCTSSGLEPHYVCTTCGALLIWSETEGEYVGVEESAIRIPPEGHRKGSPEKGPVRPATCSSIGGYNLTYRCKNCARVLTVERIDLPVDPDAHRWGEWIVTKQASETQEGEEMRVCSLCERQETRAMPKKTETDPASGRDGTAASDKGGGRRAGSVRTGDDTRLWAWELLAAAALVSLIVTILIRRRK